MGLRKNRKGKLENNGVESNNSTAVSASHLSDVKQKVISEKNSGFETTKAKLIEAERELKNVIDENNALKNELAATKSKLAFSNNSIDKLYQNNYQEIWWKELGLDNELLISANNKNLECSAKLKKAEDAFNNILNRVKFINKELDAKGFDLLLLRDGDIILNHYTVLLSHCKDLDSIYKENGMIFKEVSAESDAWSSICHEMICPHLATPSTIGPEWNDCTYYVESSELYFLKEIVHQ